MLEPHLSKYKEGDHEMTKAKNFEYQGIIKVMTAEAFCKKLSDKGWNILPERLISLANSGHIPHYRCDDQPPVFHFRTTLNWIMQNLVKENNG